MHPALSVIFFSTLSGAGYGLLVFVVLGRLGWLPNSQTAISIGFVVATLLICVGLVSSTFHLGRPERAWRAFSQWRSSWLSREGVLAVVTFVPMMVLVLQWFFWPQAEMLVRVAGLMVVVLSLLTVFTTSMIYASLKPIPAWANPWTPAAYLLLALMTGAGLYYLLMVTHQTPHSMLLELVAGLILSAAVIKIVYWRHIATDSGRSSPETATGLATLGRVRQLQAPHSADNYLLKEMGYKVARKHAQRLKWICFALGFVLPLAMMLLALFFQGLASKFLVVVAITVMAVGVFIERWLFFAEAKHVVTHYYFEGES